MKKLLLLLSLVTLVNCTKDEDVQKFTITLDSSDGVTIKCPDANVGDTGTVNGKVYTVVDEAQLRDMISKDEDVTCVCTSKVTDMTYLFQAVGFDPYLSPSVISDFNQEIGSWDTSAVTNMKGMFMEASAFNGDISSWNTTAVTDMGGMFMEAISFNGDMSSWNTAAVINMSQMFTEATFFNGDISSWNTAAVTSMVDMFFRTSFNQNISGWDTSNVTDMSRMFSETPFNQNISGWNTAAVTDMWGMFEGANSFNQNIGSWNTAAVTSMRVMFQNATAFNQNLTGWCVSELYDSNEPDDFATSSALTDANKPVWGTCP